MCSDITAAFNRFVADDVAAELAIDEQNGFPMSTSDSNPVTVELETATLRALSTLRDNCEAIRNQIEIAHNAFIGHDYREAVHSLMIVEVDISKLYDMAAAVCREAEEVRDRQPG